MEELDYDQDQEQDTVGIRQRGASPLSKNLHEVCICSEIYLVVMGFLNCWNDIYLK